MKTNLQVISLKVKLLLSAVLFLNTSLSLSKTKVSGDVKFHTISGQHSLISGEGAVTQESFVGSSRFNVFHTISEQQNFEWAYKFSWQFAQSQGNSFEFTPVNYRIADIEANPSGLQSEEFHFNQNLDRFLWNYSAEAWEVLLGRQAVNFGSGRSVNPTDVFLPYAPALVDIEHRVGVDALRLKRTLGEMGELDLGIVFGQDLKQENSALFFGVRRPIARWDTLIQWIHFRDNHLIGVDIQGDLWGQGVWTEFAWTKISEKTTFKKENYFRLVAGADYKWDSESIAYVEYHYNGAGFNNPEDYQNRSSSLAFTEGSVFFLNQHYLAPGVHLQLDPLRGLNSQIIYNITDQSVFWSQTLDWSLSDNSYLDINLSLIAGKSNSEFNNYANKIFFSYRMYF